MKVVFIEEVPRVGKIGDVKNVADGYGRNYLLPKKLAMLATPAALKEAEIRALKEQARLERIAADLEKLAQQLEGLTLSFTEKVTSEDNLYGSVRDSEIASQLNELKELAGTEFEIDRKKVELVEPLRKLGEYEVTVRLSKDLTPKIKVIISAEE